jgi:hypothetical protein
MWSACSEEARAELKKDERFQEIHDAVNDPLNLWQLLVKHCSVVTKSGDVLGAQMAAEKASGTFGQDGSMSLTMFLKEFNARRAIMDIHECDVPSEIKQAALFTEKLDSAWYWQLKDFVRSSVVPQKLRCQRHMSKQASRL